MASLVSDGLVFEIDTATTTATLVGSAVTPPKGDFSLPAYVTSGKTSFEVAAIAKNAFAQCPDVTSVSLPATLREVDAEALANCPSLASVTVSSKSETFASLDGMLFTKDYSHLLLIPEGKEGAVTIPGSTQFIPALAFSRCQGSSLTAGDGSTTFTSLNGMLFTNDMKTLIACPPRVGAAVVVPSETETIGEYALAGCKDLTSITALGNVREIDATAFVDEVKASAVVALPAGEDYDDRKAVWEAAGFQHFAQPAEPGATTRPEADASTDVNSNAASGLVFTLLDDYTLSVAWEGVKDPAAEVEIPASAEINGVSYRVSTIAANAFANRGALTGVNLPAGVTTIGEAAFAGCANLTSVSLPDTLQLINERAFEATSLTDVWLPTSVTSINSRAFASCEALTRIVALNTPEVADDALAGCANLSVYCPYDESNTYPWNLGLLANNNHLMPYGLSLPEELCSMFVGDSVSLLETNNEKGSTGFIKAPERVETELSYSAVPLYVDTANLTARGKAEGASEVIIKLTLDGFELARASRFIEVASGVSFLSNNPEPDCWPEAVRTPSGHLVTGLYNQLQRIGQGDNTDGRLVFPTNVTFQPVMWDTYVSSPFRLTGYGKGNPSGDGYADVGSLIDPEKIVSIDMPNGSISEISRGVFENFTNLKSLLIGSSLTAIKDIAFKGCPGISEIIVDSYVDVAGDAFDDYVKNSAVVRIYDRSSGVQLLAPDGDPDTYEERRKKWSGWAGGANTFLNIVQIGTVGDIFWNDDRTLKFTVISVNGSTGTVSVGAGDQKPSGVLTIPQTITDAASGKTYSVTEITENGFVGCSDIVSINVAGTITSVPVNSFDVSTCNLAKVMLPNGIIEGKNFSTRKSIWINAGFASANVSPTNPYTVTFVANGGIPLPVQQLLGSGEKVIKPGNISKDNYIFDGWFYDPAEKTVYDFDSAVTGSFSLYAHWTPVPYTITYYLDGGQQTGAPSGFTIESADITLPTPEKAGYTFAGWYDNAELSGRAITTIPTGSYNNKEFWAKWTLNAYDVTFDTHGGSAIDKLTVQPGSKITKPSDPARDGYVFAGWFSDAAYTSAWNFDSAVTSNITLHAKWDAVDGDFIYSRLADDTLSVRVNSASAATIKHADIPASHLFEGGTLPVTYIADQGFSTCSQLTSLVVPASVTTIGASAFSGCVKLTEILGLPSALSIGTNAFSGISASATVYCPEAAKKTWTTKGLTSAVALSIEAPETLAVPINFASIEFSVKLSIPDTSAFAQNLSLTWSGANSTIAQFQPSADGRTITVVPVAQSGSFNVTASLTYTNATGTKTEVVTATTEVSLRQPHGPLPTVNDADNNNEDKAGWSLDANGLLKVWSTEDVADFGWLDTNANEITNHWRPFCEYVKAVDINVTGTPSMAKWFQHMRNLTDISRLRIPQGTECLQQMLEDCSSLTHIPDTFFIPESVTNAKSLLNSCTSLTTLPNTFVIPGNVEVMSYLFSKCTSLEHLPEGFAIKKNSAAPQDAAGLFYSCSSLQSLPESFVLPDSVVNVDRMFFQCVSLTSLPENFSIPPAITGASNVYGIFWGCDNLLMYPKNFSIPDSAVGATKVFYTTTSKPLYYVGADPAMFKISADQWTIYNRTFVTPHNGSVLFNLSSKSGSGWDEWGMLDPDATTGRVAQPAVPERAGQVFTLWYADQACTQRFNFAKTPDQNGLTPDSNGCYTVYGKYIARESTAQPLPTTDGETHASWELLPDGTLHISCEEGYTIADLGWDADTLWKEYWGPVRSQVKRVQMDANAKASVMDYWFASMDALQDATGIFIPEGTTSVRGLFDGCSSLAKLPVDFAIPEGVTDIRGMLQLCPQLTTLPNGFSLPHSAREVAGMFEGAGITALPAGFTITDNVIDTSWMFQSCEHLVELPEGFAFPNSGNLTSVKNMFNMAFALKSLPEGFTIPQSVSNCEALFGSCRSLTSVPEGFALPIRADLNAKWMFQACNSLTVLPASLNFKKLQDVGWDVAANTSEMFMVYSNQVANPLPTIYLGTAENIPAADWWSSMRRVLYTPNDTGGSMPDGTHLVKFVVPGEKADEWVDYVTMPTDAEGKLASPGDPSRFGYPFQGWYTNPGCTTEFIFENTKVATDDVVLYAKFGAPILRFDAPLAATVELDATGTVSPQQVEARSCTPVAVKVSSLRCEKGAGAATVFGDPSKVSATVALGEAAALKVPLTGGDVGASATLQPSTGFANPTSLTCEVGLDLGGSPASYAPGPAIEVAHIVWTVGLG